MSSLERLETPTSTPVRAVEAAPRIVDVEEGRVEALLELVLAGDALGSWDLVESAHREGVTAVDILTALLGEVGHRLDALWDHDECSSVEVVVAMCQLRTLALHLVSVASTESPSDSSSHTAVTWAPKGDRLNFDPVMHECCLELSGWRVEKFDGLPARDVLERMRGADVDVVLCALEDPRLLESTCRGLRRFREVSPNRRLAIVGVGRAFGQCERKGDCTLNAVHRTAGDTMTFACPCSQLAS